MTQTVELAPFFERGERSRDGFPAESYVAGFREPNGATIGVEITSGVGVPLLGELRERRGHGAHVRADP